MIDISLALASYYISKVFILVLFGVFYFQFILNLIYNYYLGKKIYYKLENKENKELKKYRLTIIYMVYVATVFISLLTNLLVENVAFKLSNFHIVLIITIVPALILQFYIPKFQAEKLVKAEKELLGINNDYNETRVMLRNPVFNNWKLKPRINKILEFEDKK